MRLATFPLLFLFTLSFSQDIPKGLEAVQAENSSKIFVMMRYDQSRGLDIIRRIDENFVIVRNSFDSRREERDVFNINDEWKWAERYNDSRKTSFYISTDTSPQPFLKKVRFISYDQENHLALVEGTVKQIRNELLAHSRVTYIQKKSSDPMVESRIREHNLGLNGIRYVHRNYVDVDGSSTSVSIKEQSFDTLDIDINGRSTRDNLSNSFVVGHATDMATLVAGAGNSFISGQGVAPKANLFSESFESLFPASNGNFTSREITVQNHSYGVGIENFYGLESVAFDEQTHSLPYLLHVFSAGNSGSQQGTGQYTGMNRYGTLTGSFKQAKNVLIVTSSDEFGNVLTANSAGPAYDGRIKPELSAFGKGGTSDAAAVVSGASALLQEYYFDQKGEFPSSDITKAILIAGSMDMGTPGPDFYGGYGQLNLKRSMEIIKNDWIIEGAIADQETQSHDIIVTENEQQMNIVLAWRDPAANNGDGLALVNDIDLKASLNTDEWLPWILDSSPSINTLSAAAQRGVDHLNNVEVIQIDNPITGTYSIDASGFDVTGTQDYVIAYYLEEVDNFNWTYPTAFDPQESGAAIQLYFDNSYASAGTIEWDDLSGNWTSLGSVNPGEHYKPFDIPNINGEIVLRASLGQDVFKSDTFHVGTKPQLKVALFCDDELVINWNKITDDSIYELLAYENGAMVSKQIAIDTFAILDRTETAGLFFTVRQVGTYANGLPDETLRVDQQAIGCYLNNFLVSVDIFERVNLVANISLPQFLETLRILKVDSKDSTVFASISPSQTTHSFTDGDLTPGLTSYYALLITKNGSEILSERFSLFTTNDKKYILFPNPVTDGFINLLSPEPNALFQILQLDGKPIREFVMGAKFESFPVDLSKGTYLYRVMKGDRVLKSGKFVVGS
jgi:hypothetical protein